MMNRKDKMFGDDPRPVPDLVKQITGPLSEVCDTMAKLSLLADGVEITADRLKAKRAELLGYVHDAVGPGLTTPMMLVMKTAIVLIDKVRPQLETAAGGIAQPPPVAEPIPCPECGYLVTPVMACDGVYKLPCEHDATVCVGCAAVLVFGPGGKSLAPATSEDYARMEEDKPGSAAMLAAIAKITEAVNNQKTQADSQQEQGYQSFGAVGKGGIIESDKKPTCHEGVMDMIRSVAAWCATAEVVHEDAASRDKIDAAEFIARVNRKTVDLIPVVASAVNAASVKVSGIEDPVIDTDRMFVAAGVALIDYARPVFTNAMSVANQNEDVKKAIKQLEDKVRGEG